jgi:hypothetical protein
MIVRTIEEALAPVTDGCVLAVAREQSGVAMAATARSFAAASEGCTL